MRGRACDNHEHPPAGRDLCRAAAAAALVLITVAWTLLTWAPAAEAKSWRIDAMDVTLDVQESGDALVSEDVTFNFEGSFSYVARVIPTDALEGIEDIQVLQEGKPLPRGTEPGSYDVFTEGGDQVVQLAFNLADTSKTWTIRYLAKAAVAYYDDGDEFVWHVFDADTPVPIDRVRVFVHLPGAVPTTDLDWAVDTGVNVQSTVSGPAPSTVLFEATDIFPYTKYWIAVGFPKGVVHFTWTARRLAAAVVPKAGVLLPIGAFLWMLLVWFRRGRDDPAAVYAKYATEPPSNLSPAAAGALLDERVDTRELFATLADLARRGYLELPQSQTDRATWQVRRLRSIEDLKGLDEFVAGRLFAGGDDRVKAPMLQNRLAEISAGFDEAVFADVVHRGLFAASPQTARRHWKGRAATLGFVLFVLTVMLAIAGVGGWGYVALGSVLSVAVVYGFARVMPQRTRQGAEEQRRWEAFRNYLDDLAGFMDLPVAQETFERYLPYAIAFGVEKRWVRRFADLLVSVPQWLGPVVGPKAYQAPDFSQVRDETPSAPVGQADGAAATGAAPGGGVGLGDLASSLSTVSLSSVSDGLFAGFDKLSNVLMSAPSSTGGSHEAFGSTRVTGGRSHRSSSGRSSGSSSRSSFSGSSSSSGGGGGFSSGGGGGGGGFRAG